MAVPKRAHWNAATVAANSVGTDQLEAGAVHTSDIADDAVDATKLSDADDFIVGTLETAGKVYAAGGLQTKIGSGADILIARLQAAFGDPVGLPNGSLFLYTETTSNPDKIYLVAVMGSAFWLEELTAAAAA